MEAAIRALLPDTWEWIFHDLDLECGALPALKDLYPGPYFTSFLVPSVARIKQVHEWYMKLIDEEGPFDGLMGFSMGGYVPLSLMLKHQRTDPFEPPLFRFMILWAGNLPWSGDEEDGIEVTDWVLGHKPVPANLDEIKHFNAWASEHPDDRPDPSDPIGINPALHPLIAEWLGGKSFDRERYYTRVYHPEVTQARVVVPTLHIFGTSDEVKDGSKRMAELCDAKNRLTYEHKGGHEVPRDKTDLLKIKGLVEKIVARSSHLA